jgi:hypothetical protein
MRMDVECFEVRNPLFLYRGERRLRGRRTWEIDWDYVYISYNKISLRGWRLRVSGERKIVKENL